MLDTAPFMTASGADDAGGGSAVAGDSPGAAGGRVPLEKTRFIALGRIDSGGPHDGVGLRALFESILQWGVLQPLIVRPTARGRFEVIAGRKRFAAARSAGFTEVPCVEFEGTDADAAALSAATNSAPSAGRQLAPPVSTAPEGTAAVLRELHAVRQAIARLALEETPLEGLRRRVGRELLAVELQRASWILDALLLFQSPVESAGGPTQVGPLLRASLEPFQPECRLGGIDVRVMLEAGELACAAAEAPLRSALNCIVGAVLTSMHGGTHADPALVIHVREGKGLAVVSLSQNVVSLQGLVRLRAGARGGDVPVGEPLLASFAFEAARRTVEALGGRVELRMDAGHAGGAVDVKLPVAAPGASHAERTHSAAGA